MTTKTETETPAQDKARNGTDASTGRAVVPVSGKREIVAYTPRNDLIGHYVRYQDARRKAEMKSVLTIAEMKTLARRRVPKMFFDYADSGAWTEGTYRANEEDFARIKLRQRVLVDMTGRSRPRWWARRCRCR